MTPTDPHCPQCHTVVMEISVIETNETQIFTHYSCPQCGCSTTVCEARPEKPGK